jgi:hypothetical protein
MGPWPLSAHRRSTTRPRAYEEGNHMKDDMKDLT